MSPKESITNDRVVELIKGGVEKLGVRGLARAVGISPAIITRYTQGKVGEPSQATLQKLAVYFVVTVAHLRGEPERGSTKLAAIEDADLLYEQLKGLLEVYEIVPDRLKDVVRLALSSFREEVSATLEFHGPNISTEMTEKLHRLMDEVDISLCGSLA